MAAGDLVVHLRATGGATADITVPMPAVRTPRIRLADVVAFAVTSTSSWDGTKWVRTP